MNKYLFVKNENNELEILVPLEDISDFQSQALLCYVFGKNSLIRANILFTPFNEDKKTIMKNLINDNKLKK